jgi:hypothetical protein
MLMEDKIGRAIKRMIGFSPYFSREPPHKPPPRRSITFSVVGGLVD